MRRSRHSLAWRVGRALEEATASHPVLRRTGPAWGFGVLGLVGELVFAPLVLAVTAFIAVCSYLVIDTPWTKIREQHRPRFLSVRILYLNALIVAGFWLAVMFSFSAADPSLSTGASQRFPELLNATTVTDFKRVLTIKQPTVSQPAPVTPLAAASTWFDVFLHGCISALAVNLVLYGLVVVRRRARGRHGPHLRRDRLRYDATLGLFVDGESSSVR